jgi:cytochrome c peroxidase
MQFVPRTLVLTSVFLGLAATAAAQRTHVLGLIGEPPDTSNWPHPAAPDGNPFVRSTASAADIAQRDMVTNLGKVLFWEEQCSSDNTVACGTCHMPDAGGTDDRLGAVNANGNFGAFGMIPQAVSGFGTVDYGFLAPPSTSFDVQVTELAPPTMIGAYMFERLFWDMRAGPDFDDGFGTPLPNFPDWAALEDLAVGPPVSPVEMGHENIDWTSGFIQAKLNDAFPLAMVDPSTIPPDVAWIPALGCSYHKVFDIVFAGHSDPMLAGGSGVTRERFAAAIANYHRQLIPDQAPIDLGTMTRNQVYGMQIVDRAGCFRCHSASGSPQLAGPGGPLVDPFDNIFSDGFSHGINIDPNRRKTATLRNVGLHVKFFSTGHGGDGFTRVFVNNQSDLLDFFEFEPPPLGTGPLSPSDRADLADFLFNALTDPRAAAETFPFDRPQLYSELHPFEANEYGSATPAPGSPFVPEIIANSPPQILPSGGPSWFKVGVGNGEPNAPAWLFIDPAPNPFGPVIFVGGPAITLPANPLNAQGIGTFQQPIPLTTGMLGVPFYTQWMIYDTFGRSFSDAAEFIPFHW